jgi:hypothetical protein
LDQFAAAAESACEQSRINACRELAGRLNQAVRRIRQSVTREELGETVADTASQFASGAAWFRVTDGVVRSESLNLTIPLAEAAALREALEGREPVIALATPSEISAQLATRFTHNAQSRAYLHPIVVADKSPALLYAWADAPDEAQNAALELLAQFASAVWQALEPAPAPAPLLVSIAAAPKPVNPWDSLSAQDQQIHLRAQRFARVQVAEIRLHSAPAVQTGRVRRNLYQSLRDSIESAREAFRKEFFAKCPSMVDYLHLELTRTLANDDADLLGKEYPGPMV